MSLASMDGAVPAGTIVATHAEARLEGPLRRLVGSAAARRILASAGAYGVVHMDAASLAAVSGVTLRAAERVVAAAEMADAIASEVRPRSGSSAEALRQLPPGFARAETEMILAIALDGRNGVKATALVAKGGAHAVGLRVRDLFVPMVRMAASAVVLVHNHPSGDPAPSHDDLELTKEVARSGRILGIPLVDHIIVASGGVVSFFDTDLMPTEDELRV